MRKLNLRNELDLRRHMMALRECFRIEAQIGGTVGPPDTFWNSGDHVTTFAELKIGEQVDSKDLLRYDVRADQRRTLQRMVACQIPVLMLVGIKGTRRAWGMRPECDDVLLGRVQLATLADASWARHFDIDDDWFMDDVASHARGQAQIITTRRRAA
jgi:hypothetical protein